MRFSTILKRMAQQAREVDRPTPVESLPLKASPFGPPRKPTRPSARCEEVTGWEDERKQRCTKHGGHDGYHLFEEI